MNGEELRTELAKRGYDVDALAYIFKQTGVDVPAVLAAWAPVLAEMNGWRVPWWRRIFRKGKANGESR